MIRILYPILLYAIILNIITASLNKFNHFVKNPFYDNVSTSTSYLIQTGGRLTERHLAYLLSYGYKSVLSVVTFPSNDTSYNGVEGAFPSSEYEQYLLKQDYHMMMMYISSNLTLADAKMISAIISDMPKPLYIHCHVGWTASLFALIHGYMTSYPSLSSSEMIYKTGLALGYDYQATQNSVDLINAVTSSSDAVVSPSIESSLTAGESSYKSYYWPHRLGDSDNWYNSGQMLAAHVLAINSSGYHAIISFRQDKEATTRVPCYDNATGYIDNDEFSDADGYYNVTLEASSFMSMNISYYNLPLPSGDADDWSVMQYDSYAPIISEAESQHAPVLVHCASGYRSSMYILAYLAKQQAYCSAWAVLKASQVGFVLDGENSSDTDKQVVSFFQELLGC